jgi:signal transduction histidine kinase
VGSIAAQARRLETPDGPEITIDVPEPLPVLRAATEVAGHRIVTEAVTNAVRHADARTIEVRLVPDGAQALVIEVRDDGHGIPPDGEPGVGTVSMRERAEELGGRCEISPADRAGTLVRAVLPLEGVR